MTPYLSRLVLFVLLSLFQASGSLFAQPTELSASLERIDDALYHQPDLPLLNRRLDSLSAAINRSDDLRLRGFYHFIRGEAAYFGGELEKPIRQYQIADSLMAVLRDSSSAHWVSIKDRLAGRLSQQGRIYEATQKFLEGMALAKQQRDSSLLLNLQTELVGHYSRNFFFELAEEQARQAEQLARRLGNEQQRMEIALIRMIDATRREDDSLTIALVRQWEPFFRTNNWPDPRYRMFYHSVAVEAYWLAEKRARVDYHYAKADALARGPLAGNAKYSINARFSKAVWHTVHSRTAEARAIARELLAIAEESENPNLQEVMYRLNYRVEMTLGDGIAAARYLEKLSSLRYTMLNRNRTEQIRYFRELFEREQSQAERLRQEREIATVRRAGRRRLAALIAFFGLLIGVGVVVSLFRSRRGARALLALQSRHAQEMIATTGRLRRRIAMNLHDSVGQNLVLLRQFLGQHTELSPETDRMLTEVIEEVRTISHEVHNTTLEQLGLPIALEQLLERMDRGTRLFVNAEIDVDGLDLEPETAQQLYAIAQEAIQNVVKHARATAVRVGLRLVAGGLELTIADNGVGRPVGRGREGLGTYSMRERAALIGAELRIESPAEGGTTVRITKPVDHAA